MESSVVDTQPSKCENCKKTNRYEGMTPKVGEWSTGICECGQDCGLACYATFCQWGILDDLAVRMNVEKLDCCLLNKTYLVDLREALRRRYAIEGDYWDDWCAIHWCYGCAAAQMLREMDIREQQQQNQQHWQQRGFNNI